jgi:prepilin peptidase CpaA
VWTRALWEQGVVSLQWGVPAAASLGGALFDVTTGRIPNALVATVALSGFGCAWWWAGWPGLLDAAVACGLMMLPYVLLFIFASGGAGDAKMMGALGTWLGVINGTITLLCVAASGILMGVAFALACRRARQALANVAWALRLALYHLALTKSLKGLSLEPPTAADGPSGARKMPYGVAIFAGVCGAAAGVLLWRA